MPTATLTFRPMLGGGREVARLGEIIVGELSAFPGRRMAFTWRVKLADHSVSVGPAASRKEARGAITGAVNQWLERAGLIYPGGRVLVIVDEPQSERAVLNVR